MQLINMKMHFFFEKAKRSDSGSVLPGRHLPQQSAAVGFQRSLLGGRADAGGHLEVQSPQRLRVCGGHPAQGQPPVGKQPYTMVLYVQVGFKFSSRAVSAGCAYNKSLALCNVLCPLHRSDFPEKTSLLSS